MWAPQHNKLILLKLDLGDYEEPLLAEKLLVAGLEYDKNSADVYLEFSRLFARFAVTAQPHGGQLYWNATKKGADHYIYFEYEVREAGLEAAYATEEAFIALLKKNTKPDQQALKEKLAKLYEQHMGATTRALLEAAQQKDIPCAYMPGGIYLLGHGKHQKKLALALAESTSFLGVDIAGDKHLTKKYLNRARIPTPRGLVIEKESLLERVVEKLGYPLVTKPLDGHKGEGITCCIDDLKVLQRGFREAKEISSRVVVERHITGNDYRLLVIGYKFAAAVKRTPAHVKGNGKSTVAQLVDEENSRPERGAGREARMYPLRIDKHTIDLLELKGLTPAYVPAQGEIVYLKDTANLSTGGSATDVTNEIHPENIFLAERIARLIGLDICGIDVMAPELSVPFQQNNGTVIEVNAQPGLLMHVRPSFGEPRPVAGKVIDMMFPEGNGTIPVIAVDGTNASAALMFLLAIMARQEDYSVGYTSAEGIYLNDHRICEEDCAAQEDASLVLQEPSVDFAILQCNLRAIIHAGLAFDQCNLAIVPFTDGGRFETTEVTEDMAAARAVMLGTVKKNGFVILSADDDLTFSMRDKLNCRIALFSVSSDNVLIEEHCKNGGLAAMSDGRGSVLIQKGNEKIVVENVVSLLTFKGARYLRIEDLLAAVLASFALGFPLQNIRKALSAFGRGGLD